MNRTLLKKMAREIWERKWALLALVMIVAIGAGCFIGMRSLYRDMNGSRLRYNAEQQLADFQVDLKRAPVWAVEELAEMPNVSEARGRVSMAVRIDIPGQDEPVAGTAISMPADHRPVLNDVLLRTGAWFSGPDAKEAVLNSSFAAANKLKPGDRLRVVLLDRQHDLLIVGTGMSPEYVTLLPPSGGFAPDPKRTGVMYLPERFLQQSCDLDGAYNQVIGRLHDSSDAALDNTLKDIERRLDEYGVLNTTAMTDLGSVRFLIDEMQGLRISSTVMPAILLAVAALVLNVMISRMVIQHRTVIGTLKAIGYSTGAITRHYLGFGLAVGLAGGVAGSAFGVWTQTEILAIYRTFFDLPSVPGHFYWDIHLLGLLISVLFACAGTLKAVRFAARLNPAVAMRPPPPEKAGRVWIERIGPVWRLFPFRWKMIMRAIFRNPFRSSVSVFACMISTALIVESLCMVDALEYMMDYQFSRVMHEDLSIALRDPDASRAMREVGRLNGVTFTEAQLGVICDLSNGPYERRTSVTGLPRDGRLFTPLDSNGASIRVPESGLVLTKKLAELLNVKPGDVIRLRPLIGERKTVSAPVAAVVEVFLGLGAYADLEYLSRLLGEYRVANNVLCLGGLSGEDTIDSALLNEVRRRPDIIGVGARMRSLNQMNDTFAENQRGMLVALIFFSGLIAFASVFNTALVSLSERRREVGTLRVLGYSPRQIARIFSGESLLLNGGGILIGMAAGAGLCHLLALAYNTELYRFPVVIYPIRLLQSAVLMAIFIGASQLIIFAMIQRLQWLEALKIRE
ncbi:ABC transporter permease [Candidatus Sumerlaeota bacterium]|nr:ABC transporter permease [Candidatus Sumerlaeota bacterium]